MHQQSAFPVCLQAAGRGSRTLWLQQFSFRDKTLQSQPELSRGGAELVLKAVPRAPAEPWADGEVALSWNSSSPASAAVPNECGLSCDATVVSAAASCRFRAPTPHNALCFPLGFPSRGSWPQALLPCVVPHSFLLGEHPACPRFLCRAEFLPRGILPSSHTISSHQLWLQTTVTAQHWHRQRNSTFAHSLLRWPSLSEKSKTVFHSGAVLYCPSSWNMWGMMWGTNQNYLAKALMRSLQFGVLTVSLSGQPHQSPALVIKSLSLFQPCQFIIAQEFGFLGEPGAGSGQCWRLHRRALVLGTLVIWFVHSTSTLHVESRGEGSL